GDSPFLLVRLVALVEGLRRGELLPRWSPELSYGLGYPLFDFYGALAYYLATALHLAGLPAVEALKLVQAGGFAAASLAAFALARRHVGDLGGLVAAAAYGYAPYHLVNVYARGDSLGEFTAMALLPALLVALEVAAEGRLVGGVATALLFGSLILSHNLSALLAAPIVALWALWALASRWRAGARPPWRGIAAVGGGLAAGAGLTSYYWLPVLYDRRYIHFEHNTTGYFDFRGHFLAIGRLVQPALGYDYGLAGTSDGSLPFQLGLGQALLAFTGLVAAAVLVAARRRPPARAGWPLAALGLAIAAGYLALATPLGRPLWERLEPLQVVQFPWRLLAPASLGLALLAAAPAAALPARARAAWAIAAIAIAVVGGWGATPERWRIPDQDVDVAHVQRYEYLTSSIGSTVRYEYLPIAARERPWTSSYIAFPGGAGLRALAGQSIAAEPAGPLALRTSGPAGSLVVEHHFFPGWRALVDGGEVPVSASDPEGYLRIELPAGQHLLELVFAETRPRRLARYASIATAALAALGLAGLALLGRWRPRLPAEAGAAEAGAAEDGQAGSGRAGGGLPLVLGVAALALFALRAPLAEWLATPPDDGWDRRFAHEHAPWPYLAPDGIQLGAARVLAYRQPEITPGATASLMLSTEGGPQTVTVRLIAPAEAIVQAPRALGSTTAVIGGGVVRLGVAVPAGTPPGLYQFELAVDGGRRWLLEPLRIDRQPRPQAQTAGFAIFGGELGLDGVVPTGDASVARPAFQLRWRTTRVPSGDWRISTRLVDEAGHVWASADGRPADGFYPTRLWQARELVVERRDLTARLGTPPGRYRLEVRVYSLAEGRGGGRTELETVDARGQVAPLYRSGRFSLPAGPEPPAPPPGSPPLEWLETRLGVAEAAVGTTLPLELLWRAGAPRASDLTLLLQVGPLQQRQPVGGAAWRPGE
ncbi:MAG TPA: hypothetical protein VGL23_21620, partial [Chloroflexota bacterium]